MNPAFGMQKMHYITKQSYIYYICGFLTLYGLIKILTVLVEVYDCAESDKEIFILIVQSEK